MAGRKKRNSAVELPAKELNKIGPGIRPCTICKQSLKAKGANEFEKAGRFFQLESSKNNAQYFHYFCLLFSTNGIQRGSDNEGVLGFLRNDINDILEKSHRKKCYICGENNATTMCKQSGCDKWFHYTCGQSKGALFVFSSMHSFCHNHWPKSKHKLKFPDKICMSGCQEEVRETERSLISPCCGRIYHTECVQNMAISYGRAHFKCPLCQDKKAFITEAINFGIYIPTKDADWEQPEQEEFYNFQQMGTLYQTCDAKYCACTKGRKFSFPGTRFEIIRCYSCGSRAVHIFCGRLLLKAPFFVCEDHEGAEEEMEAHKKEAMKRLKQENLSECSESAIKDDQWVRSESSMIVDQGPVRKNRQAANPRPSSPKPSTSTAAQRKRKRPSTVVSSKPSKAVKELVIDSSGDEEDIKVISEVKKPFMLQNLITKEATPMRVGPILEDFELSPSLEGLGLRITQNFARHIQQEKRPSSATSSDSASMPRIVGAFPLKNFAENEIIEID